MENLKETTITSEKVYDGALLRVRKDTVALPDGKSSVREYIRHPGAVALIAWLPDGKLLFIRQFRYPLKRVFIELPAGKIDPGENPEQTGLRELEEETGYRAEKLRFLMRIHPCIGYSDEVIDIYEAFDLQKTECRPDEHEFMEIFSLSLTEALSMIDKGEITDVKTLAGIFAVNHRKGRS
ncbi:MAG: NUDIX hydrolase [Candidatus Neomarinimicrobiota bacterium]|jgi:ADP-ribose pyrophosphatase|nr:NUDIX hydrolase [Candidatus Neomarinimicrobiota bacterium]MDD3966703.1 NUDIX hydrolase [Candidatus Neomarinimicrobiota bacterium]MDX9780288.1 NUDIX hydrolase [bacterium]